MAYSGVDVEITLGTKMISADKVTLKIEDASTFAKKNGRPSGRLRGAVSASGDITLHTKELLKIVEMANQAGSWQELPVFDLNFNVANSIDGAFTVDAFGIALKLSDVIDADRNGEAEIMHTINFDVTGEEFVSINGVPYLAVSGIEKL